MAVLKLYSSKEKNELFQTVSAVALRCPTCLMKQLLSPHHCTTTTITTTNFRSDNSLICSVRRCSKREAAAARQYAGGCESFDQLGTQQLPSSVLK